MITGISEELYAPDELDGVEYLQDDALSSGVVKVSLADLWLLV